MGTPAGDSWGEEDNPRRYDAYAREYPNYRETSRDLIAVALPSAEATTADAAVVDLGCGTGATAREILAVLGPAGRVTGVDKSAAMLAVAANSTADPRASWIRAPAEHVDQHLPAPVDVVICNSAMWQTDLAATALVVRTVLKAGGCFAFNVPVGFLDEENGGRSSDRYPALIEEMRAIAERDYGWAADEHPAGRVRRPLSRESISIALETAGFSVEPVTEVSHVNSPESQRAWLSVPIFTSDRLPGLAYQHRMRILDKAYERLGPGRPERARWAVFAGRVPS
jgi:SAM-dependent methyltransferase